MLSLERAMSALEFHAGECHGKPGRNEYGTSNVWRRNGATRTWKTMPGRFMIPVKFGLYDYAYITEMDAPGSVHAAQDCPLSCADRSSLLP